MSKRRTSFRVAMDAMNVLGRTDCAGGKPITAFPDREERAKIHKLAAIFADRARAAYEMGWREQKQANATARIFDGKKRNHCSHCPFPDGCVVCTLP